MLLLVVCLLAGFTAGAQQTLIDVKVDTADILVGEQTTLHVTVTTDPNRRIIIPLPSDTLMTGVEVISVSDADSTVADGRLVIRRDILVTSFDSSLYLLPPFIAIDGADTIASNQVALKVSTVPVDVDNPEKFYDIKDVWKPPFVLADYYPWIFGVLTALFLICVIGYLVQRYRRHRSEVPIKPAEQELPPYETAIRELDSIKDQKLWQQGLNKEYYTQVTDTLRRYISRRYGVNAMEKTSEEILAIIERETDERTVYDTLRQVLRLSDYVKFAKLHPLPDENDESMRNAYLFVNQTKRAEAPQPDEAAPETVTKEDKK
ncbi:hypothetical protein T229_05600 [Tannerella sp. oral taxon BU063 isolate Cell 5]|uniref:Cell wall anchor protein n=1 Tax=Tannerella sp. oral taxon BU063 isolate Cell 5 TaxID=1410950 RepID=W2CCV0_9BACT|nr:hypothetical protein T229_05600 [Tannerella sp. oral taxon BU063 isolate Cell 5]